MVQRYVAAHDAFYENEIGYFVLHSKYAELEAENARLRQQRDAANAQLDFLVEEMKKAP